MKTKPLTFLLALTFLFLFSGNSFGGVFDKKGESMVLFCYVTRDSDDHLYYAVNMEDKTVKSYRGEKLIEIYTINKENAVFIEGVNKTKDRSVVIYRNTINFREIKGTILVKQLKKGEKEETMREWSSRWCVDTEKKF